MTADVLVIVLAAARNDHNLTGAHVSEYSLYRHRRAAAAQNRALHISHVYARSLQKTGKPVVIRIVPCQSAAAVPHNRIDTSYGFGMVRNLVAVLHDRLLVGNRHVKSAVFLSPEQRFQLFFADLAEIKRVISELAVNQRRIAVRQLLAD